MSMSVLDEVMLGGIGGAPAAVAEAEPASDEDIAELMEAGFMPRSVGGDGASEADVDEEGNVSLSDLGDDESPESWGDDDATSDDGEE
jgi:hypothetical protein